MGINKDFEETRTTYEINIKIAPKWKRILRLPRVFWGHYRVCQRYSPYKGTNPKGILLAIYYAYSLAKML